MSDIAIKIENLSKQYRLGVVGTGTLSHDLRRWWTVSVRGKEDPYLKIGETNVQHSKGGSEYVWALRDINLEVKKGEVIGIIGKNGAGKSTLLKILSRVTKPTTGTIEYKGRIASLLEVGTGFHPEMTGRENIFMNGSIMGMTRVEIKRKLDEIVDFAGVERYIDTPVKRYSSGMTVRLGFAIAAHLEPEILVVDEVLAVGDAEFQKKAIGKMQDVSHTSGRTVLFVSHNMAAVEALCTNGLVLQNGTSSFSGKVAESIDYYLNSNVFIESSIISGIKYLNSEMTINYITINGNENNVINISQNLTSLNIVIGGIVKSQKKISMEIRFYDRMDKIIALFAPGHLLGQLKDYKAGTFEINETIQLPKNLTKGEFYIDIDLTHPNIEGYLNIPKHVRLISNGIIGATGIEFNYAECGLLLL